MKKPELPRGLKWRGDSIVASFALKDVRCRDGGHVPDCECGKIERRTIGEVSVSYADQQLKIFKRAVDEGKYEKRQPRPEPQPKVTVANVWDLYTKTYTLKGKRALWRQQAAWKHLKLVFGEIRPEAITTAKLIDYQTARKEQGASNATVNRELAALSAALYRGAKTTIAGGKAMLDRVVVFPDKLPESAPRSGFLTAEQFATIAANAKSLWLRTFIECAHSFGFRRNELLRMRVRQVDFFDGWLMLDHGTTKNGQARKVKMTAKVSELMRACCAGKDADSFVFTRDDGSRVVDPRDDWYALCVTSGLGRYVPAKRANGKDYQRYVGLTPHDFRRTCARNLIRAGVDETVAMKVTGHKTREVFKRYNITDDADLTDATKKIETYPLSTPVGTTDTKTDTSPENPRSDPS